MDLDYLLRKQQHKIELCLKEIQSFRKTIYIVNKKLKFKMDLDYLIRKPHVKRKLCLKSIQSILGIKTIYIVNKKIKFYDENI